MTPERALTEVFRLADFRPGQRAVIDAVLAGRPTVAVMPTGAGKSLCYQLPAVVLGGTTLVISPLIALMKDQVDALSARGVAAAALTSHLPPQELSARLDDLAEGRLRVVYVAPERFKSGRFVEALRAAAPRLDLFAVDEAHCISEWGHDFRPDYLRLGELVAQLAPPRVLALTATATPEVRRDIAAKLGLRDPLVLVRGFDRPNLRLSVVSVRGAAEKSRKLVEQLRERRGGGPGSGVALVYAATRKNAESYAADLAAAHLRVGVYHAGLEAEARAKVQDRYMIGKLDAIVATNAFGMGVDKSDIRLVVHADLPRSPEAYYQEAGRAGRDGDAAECVLLFAEGDVRLQEFLIDAGCPSVEVLRALWRLLRDEPRRGASPDRLGKLLPGSPSDAAVGAAARYLVRAGYLRDDDGVLVAIRPGEDPDAPPPAPIDAKALEARAQLERDKLARMVGYARSAGCRRRFLLDYFGDEDAPAMTVCAGCDNCLGTGRRELTPVEGVDARAALRAVAALRGRFGRGRVAGLLAGADDDARFEEMPDRGALRHRGVRGSLDLLRALEGAGLVVASPGEYPTLSITIEGKRALERGELPQLALAEAAPARTRVRRPGARRRRA